MKYITTTQDDGKEEIFLFPREVNHDCMAEMLRGIRSQTHDEWERIRREPIAAGFIDGGKCTGRSETLNLKSRPEDNRLLPWSNR